MPKLFSKHSFWIFSVLIWLISIVRLYAQQPQLPMPTLPPINNIPNATTTAPQSNPEQQVDKQDTKTTPSQDEMQPTDTKQEEEIVDNEEYEDEVEMRRKREADPNYVNRLPVFGNEIFRSGSPIQPNNNIPIPLNYIMGPKDVVSLDITGNSVVSWELEVKPDNTILIPSIGPLVIGGYTIEEAREKIKNKLNANNFSIDRGSQLTLSLSNIRSINITIMGEVRKPGNYTVSSLTTVFNALYRSGGINRSGTYRAVKLIRDNRVVDEIDLYDFIVYGDMSANVTLKDNDIIQIPPYNNRVGLYGEVKRDALFEVKPNESLKDVIRFAGGFTEFAYTTVIKATQVTTRELRYKDIYYVEFDTYRPMNGDRYKVGRILDRFENRVAIQGLVYRPGDYSLDEAPTLKSLIELADGLKEEAFLERAYLIRMNEEDHSQEVVQINLRGIIEGTSPDIRLQREDIITISSMYELSDQSVVSINGKIKEGGAFPYFKGMTVEDLILRANGFTDGADYHRIEIARRVKDSDRKAKDAKLVEIITISVDPYLKLKDAQFVLDPYDHVSVFPLLGTAKPKVVEIEGEVIVPGSYSLLKRNDRISDLIKRSGGFTDLAYLKGASLIRHNKNNTKNEVAMDRFKELNKEIQILQQKNDLDAVDKQYLSVSERATDEAKFVSINLEKIIKNPGSTFDLVLEEGDRLSVPNNPQTVSISGQVNISAIASYEKGKSLNDYVKENAGGYGQQAFKRKSYVVYQNGEFKSKRFLKGNPKIEPGAEIIVPYKVPKERNPLGLPGIIGLTSGITSTIALIYAIIKN